jgi:hypothetical protein
MGEDHLRRISRFQGHPRRIVQDGETIRDVRMAQTVPGPRKTIAKLPSCVLRGFVNANRPRDLQDGGEPQFEIIRNANQPPLPDFGLACCDSDEAPI